MWHTLQWEMHSKLEGNVPPRIMEHGGEIGFQEKDSKIKGEQSHN